MKFYADCYLFSAIDDENLSEFSEIRSDKYVDFALSSFCYTGDTNVTRTI